MSKYRISFLVISVISAIAAHALECTPGSLKSLIANPETAASLSLSGQIDASDLKFIASEMPALKTLDLQNIEIVKLRDSNTIYPEKEIPAMLFAGAGFASLTLPAQEGLIIGEGAFAGAKIKSLVIPATVKKTADGAFAGCPELESVTVNATTAFGSDVFNGCTALANVNLGGASSVANSMFAGCTALKQVTDGESLLSIGDRAFAGDKALTAFEFAASLQKIGNEAFTHSGLIEANLAGCPSLKEIGERAFAANTSLRAASLPSSLTAIGSGVFAMDALLADVSLPEAVTEIPDYAFTSTAAVDDAALIHGNVQQIGAYALKGHNATESLSLPPSVSYIGDHAMEGMTSLKEINVEQHTEVPELGEDVWAGVDQGKVELKVGENMVTPFRNAAQWQEFSIKSPTVGIIDAATDDRGVKARFNGYVLEIASSSTDITLVELYATDGRMLTRVSADSNSVEINTEAWQENIYIASVTLADGSKATAKLMRII